MRKIKINQKGMGIMEIMVTISLIVFILSFATINYRGGNKRVEIIMIARKVVSDLRLAQSYAASSKKGSTLNENIWGLYFDKSSTDYIIFFTDNESNKHRTNEPVFRRLTLPHNITIDEINCDGNNTYNNLTVRFTPPDPKVKIYVNGNSTGCNNVILTLKEAVNDSIKKIKINYFGLIEEVIN